MTWIIFLPSIFNCQDKFDSFDVSLSNGKVKAPGGLPYVHARVPRFKKVMIVGINFMY